MTGADDDSDLLRLYRAQVRALPSAALDARILAASRAASGHKWLMLLLPAAAAAACLMLSLQPVYQAPQAQTRTIVIGTTAGLHDGQVLQQLADPEVMRQMAVTQLPGGSDGGRENGS